MLLTCIMTVQHRGGGSRARESWRSAVIRGAAILFAGFTSLAGATEPIFRCPDENGRILYTSERCKNGVELSIDAGQPNPAAIDRLRRDVDVDRQKEAFKQAQRAQEDAYRASVVDLEGRQAQEARYAAMQEAMLGNGSCDYCGVWTFFPYFPPHAKRPPRARVRPPPTFLPR